MKKLGRNDLCFCESGKKYKKCCLSKVEKNKGGFIFPVTHQTISKLKVPWKDLENVPQKILEASGFKNREDLVGANDNVLAMEKTISNYLKNNESLKKEREIPKVVLEENGNLEIIKE